MDNKEVKKIIRDKMASLYESVVSPEMLDHLKNGRTVHMTLTLAGKFEIWWDEKRPDHMSPLEGELE